MPCHGVAPFFPALLLRARPSLAITRAHNPPEPSPAKFSQ